MPPLPALAGLALVLVVASVVDLRERRIPNGCVVAVLVLGMARVVWAHDPSRGPVALALELAGALVPGLAVGTFLLAFSLATARLLHAPGMGGGDLKLLAALSCHLGLEGGLVLVALSCFLALPPALVSHLVRAGRGGPGSSLLRQDFAWAPVISVAALLLVALR